MRTYDLLIMLRMVWRNLLFSIINIVGLAIGIASVIFIFLWVRNETRYDRFHENKEQIYKVIVEDQLATKTWHFATVPPPLAPYLKNNFPEIEETVRLISYQTLVKTDDATFSEPAVHYGDPELFSVFSIPWIRGNQEHALQDPYAIAISENIANKYFGDENPMGKTLTLDGTDLFTVRGVFKDIPEYSSIKIQLFVPLSFFREVGIDTQSWNSFSYQTYVLLSDGVDLGSLLEKIGPVIDEQSASSEFTLQLQKLTDLHLYKTSGEPGRILYVKVYILIGLFLLLLAWINFMNLSTARSAKRAREIGMRKVFGASRWQLIRQLIGESLLVSLFATIHAIILVELLKPSVETITSTTLNYSLKDPAIWIVILLLMISSGILAGLYPAIVMSRFSPAKILRTNLLKGKGQVLRQFLVVFQFTTAIILVIGTLSMARQIAYMQKMNLGLHKENIIYFSLNNQLITQQSVLIDRLNNDPTVFSQTMTFQLPSNNRMSRNTTWDGADPDANYLLNLSFVDFNYIETFGLEIVDGRNYDPDRPTDSSAFIINEQMAQMMGVETPVGMQLTAGPTGEIIGIMKDYNYQPLTNSIEPIALSVSPQFYRYAVVRFKSGQFDLGLENVRNLLKELCPDYPFEYSVFEQDFTFNYRNEINLSKQILIFAIISIIIASLGLFGLATFLAEQNRKEIGIRKVLGANVPTLIRRFTLVFLKSVVIAIVISWPLAFLVIRSWMKQFAYRSGIEWWIFLLAGIIALAISSLTVAWHAFRSANRNPVEVIKYE